MEKLLVILGMLREVRGRTRLQKTVFLLSENEDVNLGYDFIPYHYGPYSQDLQLEVDLLEAAGLLQIRPRDGILYMHSLTEEGEAAARETEQEMDEAERDRLSKALRKYGRRSTNSLIKEAKKLAGMLS